MLIEAISLGGLGLISALGLGAAARVFAVEVDPLVVAVEEALPGANCGGCGQAGCSAAAVAIASGKMSPNSCVASSPEGLAAIAAALGVELKETEPQIARVGCRYPLQRSDRKYQYSGPQDCRSAFLMAGGPKKCVVGCMGLGSCVKACQFGALSIGPNGLPVVNEFRCTGCGACTRTCPVGIMGLTSVSNRILGEYDLYNCTAPCQSRCPAGIDIPTQIAATAHGDYDLALATVMERNPLPLICGRICPQPCEQDCRRGLHEQPVGINNLKRFVADKARQEGRRPELFKAPSSGEKAAVVGGGADGLSAAFFLTRLGHQVELFEAKDELGGLLRTAIPAERLPREVLDWEIGNIVHLGVNAHTGQAFGRDITAGGLFAQGNKAIYLALGGWDTVLMQDRAAEGNPAMPGLYLLMPLMLAWATGQGPALSGPVALIGGGKSSLATARRLLERGAEKVTVLLPQECQELGLEASGDPKIELVCGAKVTRILGQGDRLVGLEYRMAGQAEPVSLNTPAIIAAAGRLPDLILKPVAGQDTPASPDALKWEGLAPHRPGAGPGLFHDNGPVSDYRAVVEAVGAGRRAAASIHRLLNGQDVAPATRLLVLPKPERTVAQLEHAQPATPRQDPRLGEEAPYGQPAQELVLGLDEAAAKTEASRCLECGLICYQRTQYE